VPLLGHCDALLLALHLLTAAYCGAELLVSRYLGEPACHQPLQHKLLPGRASCRAAACVLPLLDFNSSLICLPPLHRRAEQDLDISYFTYFTNWTLMLLSLAGLVAFANVARHMWRRERGGRALVAGGLGAAATAQKAALEGAPPGRCGSRQRAGGSVPGMHAPAAGAAPASAPQRSALQRLSTRRCACLPQRGARGWAGARPGRPPEPRPRVPRLTSSRLRPVARRQHHRPRAAAHPAADPAGR
jgi:hypothetical protein